MRRYQPMWSRLTSINHLVGGVIALAATAVAWRQLGDTARRLDATANTPMSSDGAATPHIMIVVPARNEAATIAGCLASLAAQQLAPAGIWVVDDGSTDATAAIVQGMAARDARIHLVASVNRPSGWAGKNWALHQGIRAAQAATPIGCNQWLLLTDADTWHHPTLLRRAYDHASAAGLHLVSAVPRVAESDWGAMALRGAVGEFYSFYYGRDLSANANASRELAVMAQGQFMLVQNAWYQAIGSFAHPTLRAALDDDRALASRIKRVGGRVGLLSQPALLSPTGYASLRAAWQGHLHHVAPILTTPRHTWRALRALALGDVATVLPLVGLAWALQLGVTRGWRGQRLALIRWGLQLGAITLVRRRATRMAHLPHAYPALAPIGNLLLQALIAHAVWHHITGRGQIVWKGRRYP